MAKSIAEKIQDALQGKNMVLPLGEIVPILDHFMPEDFGISESETIFVKHAPLLRIAKSILSGITQRRATVIQYPEQVNNWNATVCVQYKFGCGVTWSAVADCRQKTAPRDFANYTVAMAETRASARCLREALGIEVCSAEEIIDMDDLNHIHASDKTAISDIQLAVLEKFINEKKTTLNAISEILNKNVTDIKELTRAEAEQLISILNS